jgi:hypothetical protein
VRVERVDLRRRRVGVICMSLALIGCQPRIDEPSKPMPSSKSSSSGAWMGTVVCCQMPGRSMNLRSTNLQSFFFECDDVFRASWAFVTSAAIRASTGAGRALGGSLNRVFAALAGADADGLLDGGDEDLPVADAARLGALFDGVDDVPPCRRGRRSRPSPWGRSRRRTPSRGRPLSCRRCDRSPSPRSRSCPGCRPRRGRL